MHLDPASLQGISLKLNIVAINSSKTQHKVHAANTYVHILLKIDW